MHNPNCGLELQHPTCPVGSSCHQPYRYSSLILDISCGSSARCGPAAALLRAPQHTGRVSLSPPVRVLHADCYMDHARACSEDAIVYSVGPDPNTMAALSPQLGTACALQSTAHKVREGPCAVHGVKNATHHPAPFHVLHLVAHLVACMEVYHCHWGSIAARVPPDLPSRRRGDPCRMSHQHTARTISCSQHQ